MKSIAIDGPAGAGKSTIAKKAAEKLGFVYVDTGAMYRAMALYFLRNKIDSGEEAQIEASCKDVQVSIVYKDGEQQVLLNGENVNSYIRTEQVSRMTSDTSKYPAVRKTLLALQQRLAQEQNVIMDGRDIGTCVLPNADVKIYLTASTAERARRRHLEQTQRGISCSFAEIEQDIIARDEQDMNRKVSPLRQAEDAVFLDSSEMSIDQVVEKIISIYRQKEQDA